jgi:hypothetical protein
MGLETPLPQKRGVRLDLFDKGDREGYFLDSVKAM